MFQLTNIVISQDPPIERLRAKVLVKFNVYGIIFPDSVVQFYAAGASDPSLGIYLDDLELSQNEHFGYSTILDLDAATVYQIHLCPRTVTDGTPDNYIEGEYWDTFRTAVAFTTQGTSATPPGPFSAPTISSVFPRQATLHDGASVLVGWTSSELFDKYHFMWTDAFPPPIGVAGWSAVEINSPNSRGAAFTIPGTPFGRTYTFKVQGCKEFDFGPDKCSQFSPASEVMIPVNTHSLRTFLELSNTTIAPGLLSLGAAATGAGVRRMMHLS